MICEFKTNVSSFRMNIFKGLFSYCYSLIFPHPEI